MELTKIMTFCNKQKIKFKVLCNEIGVTDVEINTTPHSTQTQPEHSATLPTSISNVFQFGFDMIMCFWEIITNGENELIRITEMDNLTVKQKTIAEVRSELTAEKRNIFDKKIEHLANSANRFLAICTINNVNDKTPYMAVLTKMSQSDIECWYDYGVINEEIKAVLMRIACKKTIDCHKEPFTNSYRRYILENIDDIC